MQIKMNGSDHPLNRSSMIFSQSLFWESFSFEDFLTHTHICS